MPASSQRDSSRFDEPVRTPTGEPAGIGQPATSVSVTATRLTIVTDVSHRSVSSITSGSSPRSAYTAASASGFDSSANRQLPMTRNVVSAPAGSSSRKKP